MYRRGIHVSCSAFRFLALASCTAGLLRRRIFLAGAPSLPPPLTPEQEKILLSRMAAGDAAARDDLITHNLRLVVYLPKSTKAAVCLPRT